ncbi:MAG: bis(5'-nucleosyl)-tetraphosphatase (symmetrical) YqeK [Candidatus Eremiobacteraeota bacterium]|nr:bis(5'-nucleosyl)-tetraphosphatase (symmetrical) YqeK [Candidatus Eremiobacteraeota bacterium]
MRVARCADLLAQRHGVDPGKARIAGLLHDLARLYPKTQLIEECESRRLPIAPFERAHPVLLHARLGAALAAEEFGVHDSDVLSAIEKHTTAAGTMSPLDCIVYLADSLEPAREFPERPALWRRALTDLTAAMRELLFLTMRHHARKGVPVAPPTLDAAAAFGIDAPDVMPLEVSASN